MNVEFVICYVQLNKERSFMESQLLTLENVIHDKFCKNHTSNKVL